MRASLSGKDMPEDIKARLLTMHEDNVVVKEALKTAQDKLAKARAGMCMARNKFSLLSLALLRHSLSSLKTNFSRGASQTRWPFDSEFRSTFLIQVLIGALIVQSSFEEAEGSFQTQIKNLKEEVQREKVCYLFSTRTL